MKRLICRAIIKNRKEKWTEEFSVITRDDMTPKEYVITVIDNRNLIARPQQLTQELVITRMIPELTTDMFHDWVRSGTAKRGKADVFICKRCGWVGYRQPGETETLVSIKYSRTPNICYWHL